MIVPLNYFSTDTGEATAAGPKKVEDMTYYEVLGIHRHASSDEIKDAFREMGVSG